MISNVLERDIEQMASLIDEYLAIGFYLCDCGGNDGAWQLLPLDLLTGVKDYL